MLGPEGWPTQHMEDDLDNLIADSLGGVQTALEGERNIRGPETAASASDALRELQKGPGRTDAAGPEFFENLLKTFQDPDFQKSMQEALQVTETSAAAEKETPKPVGEVSSAAGSSTGPKSADQSQEDFLQNFLKSFDSAVENDSNFEQRLTHLMTSMLPHELLCEQMQQIVNTLGPWLSSQKGLSAADRSRFEGQLRVNQQILAVYKGSPDPLPEQAQEQVQRLLAELSHYGPPPDEVMRQIGPQQASEGGETFEDLMKQMGLDAPMGSAEEGLLKKLTEDPEELAKVMKGMAEGLDEETCKQQ